jgi:hypothetical protein
MDYPSVLFGIAITSLAVFVWRLAFGPHKTTIEVVCNAKSPGGEATCEKSSRHLLHRGWDGRSFIQWPILFILVLLVAPLLRANDGPEPFDGEPQCSDLLGRYVKCPDPRATPAPVATPPPQRVVDPPVVQIDGETKEEEPEENVQAGARLSIAGGALAGVGGGAPADVQPGITLSYDGPLYEHRQGKATRLEVEARLGILQGEALELSENTTFRSISVAGRLCQPLGVKLYFMPCVEAGFATRLDGDSTPRTRAPRWVSVAMKAVSAQGDYISLGVGADERLDEEDGQRYRPAAHVNGSVKLWAPDNNSKVQLRLVAQAILNLRLVASRRQAPADRITLGILVSR